MGDGWSQETINSTLLMMRAHAALRSVSTTAVHLCTTVFCIDFAVHAVVCIPYTHWETLVHQRYCISSQQSSDPWSRNQEERIHYQLIRR